MIEPLASLEEIREIARKRGWRSIGIDGADGAGKSFLAKQLAASLGANAIDLDDYLLKNQDGFVDFLDYEKLRADIDASPSYVLSGVCLRKVLERLGRSCEAHIYVKRLSNGVWTDEKQCAFPDGVEAALAQERSDLLAVKRFISDQSGEPLDESAVELTALTRELMQYHYDCHPQDCADVEFLREEHVA